MGRGVLPFCRGFSRRILSAANWVSGYDEQDRVENLAGKITQDYYMNRRRYEEAILKKKL